MDGSLKPGGVLANPGSSIEVARQPSPEGAWGTYAPYAVGGGALVALMLGYLAVRWRRRRVREGAAGEARTSLEAEARREVDAAISRGDFRRAGDILARQGLDASAAENFSRAGADRRAAESFEEAGQLVVASQHYKRAGMRRRAAQLYLDAGEIAEAAAEYVAAGDRERAAECYDRAGQHERAGRQLEELGETIPAARAYERAGADERAGDLWYQQYRAIREGEVDGDLARAAQRSAELLRAAGEYARAGEVSAERGDLERASDCFEAAGHLERAAEMAEEAGQRRRAGELFDRAGARAEAERIRAVLEREAGRPREAAERLRELGAPGRAARIYDDELDEPATAGELYERDESWRLAAECHRRAGDLAAAAQCAEEAGALARASDWYREVGDVDGEIRTRMSQGDYFRAGRLLYEQRRTDEAIEALERINARDPIYRRSLELQGDVYRLDDAYDDAFSRYRAALGNRGIEDETLRIHYKMARTLEAKRAFRDAEERYERIVDVDQTFEDAADRLEAIRAILRADRTEREVSAADRDRLLTDVDSSDADPSRVGSSEERSSDRADVRYEFVEEIARGGMGIVYRARDTFLNRIVAVKVLGEELRGNETAVKYFLREARAAAALSHPNIVTIYDAGDQQGEYYLAMEYVEGQTVKQLVETEGALSEEEVRTVMVESSRALAYAHGEGVVHRDIKSDNLMVDTDGAIKVMDFGLAKFLKEFKKSHTQNVGTPYYMSPEQITGENVDFRSDLYGLGCTAFECLTGEVPFSEGELAYHHVHTEPPAPSSLREGISPELESVISRLLEKAPTDRYQSASELVDVLEAMEG